jgi:hypothetical protein
MRNTLDGLVLDLASIKIAKFHRKSRGDTSWIGATNRLAVMKIQSFSFQSETLAQLSRKLRKLKKFVIAAS